MVLKKGYTLPLAIATFLLVIILLVIYHQNSSEETFLTKNFNFLKKVSQQLQQLQNAEQVQNEQLEENILQKIEELEEKQNSIEIQENFQNIENSKLKLELENKNNSKEIIDTFDDSELKFSMSEILNGLEQDDPRILKEIRKNYLQPPSPRNVPYNFTNKDMNKFRGTDPSLGATAKRVFEILGGNIRDGIFVESGANDGEHSNTIMFERDFNWTGVLIEPQPVSLKKLYTKNRKSWISNVCSSPLTKPMKLKFNQVSYYDVASHLLINQDENHLAKKGDFITVQCFPIYSVLAALNYTIVDYFSLDVESVEFDVLKTIPFDKIIFKVITVEVQFIHDVTTAMIKYMATKGYTFAGEVYIDYIFTHNSTDFAKKLFSENEETLKKISIEKETTEKPKSNLSLIVRSNPHLYLLLLILPYIYIIIL